MKREHKLTYTEAELEAKLNSVEQAKIAELVKGLPEESVSLAWRSQLNERLLASKPVKRVRSLWRVLVPATAFASCVLLGVTIFLSREPEENMVVGPRTEASVEAAIVASYKENQRLRDIGGYGLYPEELDNTTEEHVESEFSELDLGAL